MKELETKIIQKLHQHSASEATLHVPEDIRQITLRRFEDFEQLALREKYPNIYLESTPAGKKINHGTQIQGLFPELDQLVETEPMEKIAMELFKPKNISKDQEIFVRNPGGRSIIPHQDYIYERKLKNHRTLSLNIKLNPINYREGHMSYHSVKQGTKLKHIFNASKWEWKLFSLNAQHKRMHELEDPAIHAIWHTSFSAHKARIPVKGNKRGVFIRYIVNCYDSTN